ncbi:laccase-1 [Xylaria venustula]|nr:laccase-1 [Xylaria venustula]
MKHITGYYVLTALALSQLCLVSSSAIRESRNYAESYRGPLLTHQTKSLYSDTGGNYFLTWAQTIKNFFLYILGFETDSLSSTHLVRPPLHDDQSYLSSSSSSSLCANSPTSRSCWGEYNTSTNYYLEIPDTGRTVEVWLSAEESTCNQDGYARPCLTFNGTIPGPTIVADWGDYLKVHVTNDMPSNGTSVHWHGVRMLNSVQYDGVPGVTQCAIAPGETLTYEFRVTHHFSLQYADGLYGPMIFNGPATSDYDEDLGPLVLQDWSHVPIFTAWSAAQEWGITYSLENTLINGTNTFDCHADAADDPRCLGGGKKFEMVFEQGKRYLLRLINVAVDSQFQFSIDGHALTVIAADFVPVRPYTTEAVVINSAQRYDVIVEADAEPGDYWLRGGWVHSGICQGVANDHPASMTGIVRYDASSKLTPSSQSRVPPPTTCIDEAQRDLVPFLKYDVMNVAGGMTVEELNFRFTHTGMLKWTINSTDLLIDWSNPGTETLQQIFDNETTFPENYNVVNVDSDEPDDWTVLVIENVAASLFGGIAHPIHLHGHDFWILAQKEWSKWDGTTTSFRYEDAPRRDTAILPKHGYLAIAFRLDNPGAWLCHCHIAWHASMGLSLEFVENRGSISLGRDDREVFDRTCAAWGDWDRQSPWAQEDSGI